MRSCCYKNLRDFRVYALVVDDIDLAHYLIIECGADITIPYFPDRVQLDILRNRGEKPKASYPVYLLKWLVFPLDSKEYQQKMEIVQEFERQGVDYWEEPIPNRILSQIQKIYPDTWQEYAEVY